MASKGRKHWSVVVLTHARVPVRYPYMDNGVAAIFLWISSCCWGDPLGTLLCGFVFTVGRAPVPEQCMDFTIAGIVVCECVVPESSESRRPCGCC
jgi:hypothetical protein